MSNKEEEMTNEVVDVSSPPDTQEGVVMNDNTSPTANTTTDNSDAKEIAATKEMPVHCPRIIKP